MFTSLDFTLTQAIILLTNPLVYTKAYSLDTISSLRVALRAQLTELFTAHWDESNPSFGHSRRGLRLGPDCLPPRAIYSACLASGVQWFDWMSRLNNNQLFYLFIDPGRVAMKSVKLNTLITIWSMPQSLPDLYPADEEDLRRFLPIHIREDVQTYVDSDNEQQYPVALEKPASWQTHFLGRPSSPMSDISISDSDSGVSFTESMSSYSSTSSYIKAVAKPTLIAPPVKNVLSRRERARLNRARLHVDLTKTEIIPFGQTSLLSGGVMLGANKAIAQNNRYKLQRL